MFGEVVRHATDGIHRVGPEVADPVAVEVHGVGAVAGGYELRVAHGPRVGTGEAAGRTLFLEGDLQKGGQFTTEEATAAGVMKGQRRQGIEHAVVTGDASVTGLDTDDGGDDLGRHAILGLGPLEGLRMRLDESGPVGDARRIQEDGAIFIPAQSMFGGAGHGIQHRLAELGVGQGRLQPVAVNTLVG